MLEYVLINKNITYLQLHYFVIIWNVLWNVLWNMLWNDSQFLWNALWNA